MEEEIHESKEVLLARAQSAENKLNLIYSSKLWRISRWFRKLFPAYFHISKFEKSQVKATSKSELIRPSIIKDAKTKVFNEPNKKNGFAVVAHWSSKSIFERDFIFYLERLLKSNLNLIVVSANQDLSLVDAPDSLIDNITVITKPNVGYDFGSWLAATEIFPYILNSSELIFLNDSCIGPFIEFDEIFKECRNSSFDVTSLTDSTRFGYHLQSYFLHIKNPESNSNPLMKFLSELPLIKNKSELILRYEVGFTVSMQDAGLLCGAVFPWNTHSKPWINPTIGNAEKLVELGFPFVKKEFFNKADQSEIIRVKRVVASKYHDNTELLKIIENN